MKNRKRFIVAAACVIVLGLTACAGGRDSIADGTKPVEPFPVVEESTEQDSSDMQEETETQEVQKSSSEEQQGTQGSEDEELDEQLAEYREYRESITAIPMGNGVTGSGKGPHKNPEDFGFSYDASGIENLDARELTEALETAKKYVEDNFGVPTETKYTVYTCSDPRIWAIYEAEDKGVANGYDSENIYVCEYCENGNWQYLILVRDGKGSAWEVIHHGSSYMKED